MDDEQDLGQQEDPSASEGPKLSGFAQDYLTKVPEEHREIISQHLPEWDKGFNSYSQKVQGELKAYKDLNADPEVLSNSYQLYNTLLNRPEEIYEALVNAGYGPKETKQTIQDTSTGVEDEIPAPLKEKMGEYEKALGQFASYMQKQEQERTQQRENQEFDQLMSGLETKYKGIDRDMVTRLIATGVDPDEAAQKYLSIVQGAVNENARPKAPPVLGSGSAVPRPDKPVSELSDKDRRNYIAEALKGMTNGNS